MKLSNDQLHTLREAAEQQWAARMIYSMDPDAQRAAWEDENRLHAEGYWPHKKHGFATQDEWLIDVSYMVDAIQLDSPLYLIEPSVDVDSLAQAVSNDQQALDSLLEQGGARIVLWDRLIAFFGGNGACLVYLAGTSRYFSLAGELPDGEMAQIWPSTALGMLAASLRPATPRPVGTNARYALSKAKYKPRRDFYYVANVRYENAPQQEPRGGHHSSPAAHVRSAHQALLTRVEVEAVEASDLTARGYTLVWTEELPPEVLSRMARRGKAPTPGTLNAYRWINKPEAQVNPEGEHARRVKLIR